MTCGWTAAQLRAAIDRGNAQVEAMIANRERPERIEGCRKGIEMLFLWLARAEREEREARERGQAGVGN